MVQTLHARMQACEVYRYLYDLDHSPPKFEQYTRWLRDVRLRPNDTVQATNLREIRKAHQALFTEYIDELSRAIDSIEFSDSLSHPAVTTSIPLPTPRATTPPGPSRSRQKRPATDIIAPSPEKHSQKRHQSYGHH